MTLITAHSGSDGTQENSLAFVRFFQHKPIEAIEIDVRYDQESKQLVLRHDEENIEEKTPLRAVFELMQETDLLVNCDLKEPGLEMRVKKLADQYQLWERILLSGTVDVYFLSRWPAHILMNIENGLEQSLSWEHWTEQTVLEAANYLISRGATRLNLPYQCYTERLATLARKHNVALSLWTVNSLQDLSYFEEHNVYNLTTRNAWKYFQVRQEVVQ